MSNVPDVITAAFPGALELHDFLDAAGVALQAHGFLPGEALAVTASCRDEIAAEYRAEVRRRWDQAFDFSSLSGLPLAGITGMRSVIDHAPQTAGHPEVVIFAMPHIGVLEDGTLGRVKRRGRSRPTTACGSITTAVRWARGVRSSEVASDPAHPDVDPLDPEQSLVQEQLYGRLGDFSKLTKTALIKAVADLMAFDLWRLIDAVTVPTEDDVAVVTGILVHGPDGDYVQPVNTRLRIDATTSEIELG